jgi:hypothetical protein
MGERLHRSHGKSTTRKEAPADSDADADPRLDEYRRLVTQERKADAISETPGAVDWRAMRARLLEVAQHELVETTEKACNILAMMALGDEAEELEPPVAKKVGQKVCDVLCNKMFAGAKIVFEIAETAGEKAFAAAGVVKGALDKASEKKELLTVVALKQAVMRSLLEAAHVYSKKLVGRIKALAPDQLAEIGRIAGSFQAFAGDDDDSPESGSLKEGLERQFLEQLGLPPTGPARAHEMATESYLVLRAQIREQKPVAEQAPELEKLAGLPAEAERKARAAERMMGRETEQEIAADEVQRSRARELSRR